MKHKSTLKRTRAIVRDILEHPPILAEEDNTCWNTVVSMELVPPITQHSLPRHVNALPLQRVVSVGTIELLE